jgi:hypothetical protein
MLIPVNSIGGTTYHYGAAWEIIEIDGNYSGWESLDHVVSKFSFCAENSMKLASFRF